jgi:hypothetical protein
MKWPTYTSHIMAQRLDPPIAIQTETTSAPL